jgi:hypothetical protein
MKAIADLNPLFEDQIINFAHLLTTEKQTKNQFLDRIKNTYDLGNPKSALFYQATLRSTFETIEITIDRETIIFNS